MRRWRSAVVAVAAAALVVPATAAQADGGGHGGHGGRGGQDTRITEVASGLEGPRQLDGFRGNKVVVAESDSAEISTVNLRNGRVEPLFSLSAPGSVNPQGVASADGQLFIALGELGEDAPPPFTDRPDQEPRCEFAAELPPGPGLVVTEVDGDVLARCDLLAYELFANPDGQSQFVDDDPALGPVDSLSNPFAVLVQHRRILVADAGANTVLSIDRRTGRIQPFFEPPVITTGLCQGAENNPETPSYPATVGCDPVPTGVVEGPDGKIYVSTLGAVTPGAGVVYVLDQHGRVVRTIEGLNPMTGIAVDRRGTVYASELLPGQVVRIDRHGNRSYVAVPTPQGLEFRDGSLYVAADSVQLGPDPVVGRVLRVGLGAFGPDQAPFQPPGPPAAP
ncbi:ScyD/ScyE family protein [Trujillonella humicola]|uniref:ScyD/ScyE family protein n=1 Tax=Trujillonella humicola TaxID=3383699 RepID=UPI003905B781